MRIKSYFAPSVQEAIERARLELGPEAMLMSSKKTGPESSRLGVYEVVFGISPETRAGSQADPKSVCAVAEAGDSGVVARELADLRKQIENVRRSVSRQGYSRQSGIERHPEFAQLEEMLLAADFSEEMAHELIESVAARTANPQLNTAHDAPGEQRPLSLELLCSLLREEIERRVRMSPELGVPDLEQRVIAFVGPSGAGKTTSLVKLALKYGIASRTPLQIFSTDTLRVGGSEQLGTLARILGVAFQATPTMAALEQALEECRSKRLILIDTPGYGSAEMSEAGDLKAFLSKNPHVEVQLVIPATLRATAMAAVLARFAIFHPSKILFTHLDDAEAPGAVLDPAMRSGLPISFLATGQQIPDDLEEASQAVLTDKLFERVRAAAPFAA